MSGIVYNAAEWLLDRHVRAGGGERTAFRCAGATVSYRELHDAVLARQAALGAFGIAAGDRVAMVVRDEVAFPAWFLGALRAGCIPVPLSTMLTPNEVGAVVADSGARAVVVSASHAAHLHAIMSAAPAVEHGVVLPGPANASDPRPLTHAVVLPQPATASVEPTPAGRPNIVDEAALLLLADASSSSSTPPAIAATTADSPAFWLYSSGTTGVPKGVMHRHASLQATAETYASSVLAMRPDDKALSVAKLFFAFGLGNSLTFPLAFGASAVLNPDAPTPASVQQLLESERPTLFFASPGFVAAMLDAQVPVESLSSVRLTVTAGEALPADLARRFSERYGVEVLDGLGTTEALHIFLSNHARDVRHGTSGRPVAGYDIELRDESGAAVDGADKPGFLHVRGPSLASGYWQRPEATADAFRDGWLRTGDVYVRDGDGCYRFLGRNNDMIKAGGIWVSPAEVESVLIEHDDVLEAAVVGARNAEGLESVVAFLVPRAGRIIDEGTIESHCRARMAAFKRPRRIVVIESLPKTATGKVQRFALRDQLASS